MDSAMTMKERLLANRVADKTATVTIEGVGDITIRALSRHELMEAESKGGMLAQERYLVSRALVEPAMTEAEVGQWQTMSLPGEINVVSRRINELSGITEGADKSGVDQVRD